MSNWYLSRKAKETHSQVLRVVRGISDQRSSTGRTTCSDIDELLLKTINEYESNSATLLYTATLTPSVDSAAATTT